MARGKHPRPSIKVPKLILIGMYGMPKTRHLFQMVEKKAIIIIITKVVCLILKEQKCSAKYNFMDQLSLSKMVVSTDKYRL